MPFMVLDRNTNQIYTCKLINKYELSYYGIKYWEDEKTAEIEVKNFLLDQHVEHFDTWEVTEIDESLMKLGNVKLKNNPKYQLFWIDKQKLETKLKE